MCEVVDGKAVLVLCESATLKGNVCGAKERNSLGNDGRTDGICLGQSVGWQMSR